MTAPLTDDLAPEPTVPPVGPSGASSAHREYLDDPRPAGFITQPSAEGVDDDAPARRQVGQWWTVDLEDGSSVEVLTTNRDLIAWERTKARHKEWPSSSDAPIFATTFAVWASAKREGLTALGFDQFVEACLDLTKLDEAPADPTR